MSGRTWLMMLLVLGINWGGFAALLCYSLIRAARRQQNVPSPPTRGERAG